MITRKAYLVKERLFEIREEELVMDDDKVLIEVKLCGLCNWELNHWKGTAEKFRKYPDTPGHEWVGYVKEVGANVTSFQVGDVVAGVGRGAFADYIVRSPRGCSKINPGIPLENALIEPLKCVTTVLRAAKPELGDYGLLLGCGPMGLWCIQGLSGNTLGGLIAVDLDDDKLALAKKYGATHTINPKNENVVDAIYRITGGRMCDFVIEGTGIPKLLNDGIDYLRKAGRLILMSSHEAACPQFDFRPAVDKGISLFVAHPSFSADHLEDMARAAILVNNGTFHNEDIVSHRFKFDDINEGFKALESKPKDYIKGIIVM